MDDVEDEQCISGDSDGNGCKIDAVDNDDNCEYYGKVNSSSTGDGGGGGGDFDSYCCHLLMV